MKKQILKGQYLPALVLPYLILGTFNATAEKVSAQEYQDTVSTQVQQNIGIDDSIKLNASKDFFLEKEPQVDNTEAIAQVTSVSQLEDVQPTDWAFQALQSLVERYGCISGYPNSTFRGNRALTRYEFAAGVNACLDSITQRLAIATGQENISRQDLETLQKLQSEFSAELATLRGRVDSLEAKTAEIEANQFSPTTKLLGTLVIGIQGRNSNRGDIAPRDGIKDTDDVGTNTTLISKTVLTFFTQFAPRNYLITNIRYMNGSNTPRFDPNPANIAAISNNDVILGYEYPAYSPTIADLFYNWQVSDNLAVKVGTAGMDMINHFRKLSPVEDPPTGALSRFGQRNPILNTGFGQGGLAIDWQITKNASLQALYSSNQASLPSVGSGLFDGNTTIGTQLLVSPSKSLNVALYYVNNYSRNGCMLTFVGDDCLTGLNPGISKPLNTNAFGGSVNWQITSGISLGGWGGYTTSSIPGASGSVETTNYMVYLNFPDLFGRGNLGGIYVGQPPRIVSSDLPEGSNVPDLINGGLGKAGGQPGTTTHIEAFYRFRVSDNISVTPGIIHLIEPGHTPNSDPVTIGVLRTTFLF
ncbi:MAG TPA: iron uptake porin [Nostocaceae cyanobacterium]|nr:iron uptake porin [Nostocaceae cyanobacterium]